MRPPHKNKKALFSAVAVLLYSAAVFFLSPALSYTQEIPYRVDPQYGGQTFELDEPEPGRKISDLDGPEPTDTGQGPKNRQRMQEPQFVKGLPPETVDAFDPWRAHESMPKATAADFEPSTPGRPAAQPAPAAPEPSRVQKPSAVDLDEMMKKMMDPSVDALEKKRLAAVVFYHQDIYRKAAMLGEFKGDSPQVKAFLEQKKLLQEEIISRMGPKYRTQFGESLKQPIIPFEYNNIFSDDDIITGTGEPGRRAEKIYNESLNDVMRQHVGRPMDALDRKRIDVNGLAWNMTQDAAHLDFSHHEKYINPQSGFANQRKLMEGAQAGKVTAFTFDDKGRMIKLTSGQTVEEIKRLAVDAPMKIPGIDSTRGSGSMSDFLRMAEMHQIKPTGRVTVEEVQQFLRNQKYSERVIGDYTDIFQADARLAKEHQAFIETSARLRKAMTVREAAEILEKTYGTKIIQRSGAVDYDALTAVMLKHQERQLGTVLPGMIAEVTKTEAYRIVEYLKTAGPANRHKLRKEMALTYAPLDDNAVKKITAQLDTMPIDEADKKFLKSVVQDDSRQIRRYAELLEIPTGELTSRLKIDGDNLAAADFISKTAKVKPLSDALAGRKGGGTFKHFLESKTARALNLDVMLSPDARGAKYMQWSMLLLASSRAYSAAGSNEEGLKAMGLATFEMVPFVASVLRFSETEYKQAFLEFAMDLYPPTALANIATTLLGFAAHTARGMFVESKWEELAVSVLKEMTADDFIESDIENYWWLKNRDQLLQYLDEVSPGLGRIAKLSALIEPDIDARMYRHPDVQTNNAAIHTLQWFQEFDVAGVTLKYKKMFDLEQLRSRVYETGIPAAGAVSPVERVAALILMDNLRIRKELYYQVLNDFMDRIERLYNEKKEQEEGGYGAIVGKALAALKDIYENAPQKIKDSPWGMDNLRDDYRGRVEHMTSYKPQPAGKPVIDIQREMQGILDDFREFIKKLVIVVDIQEEMRYLDLKAYVYGGRDSFESADYLLLGDQFRVGISTRVSPKRRDLKWTLYYYALSHETGRVKLLGSVKLDRHKFAPGNEGYWVIEPPNKETFMTVNEKLVDEFFSKERWYFIRPVIAFGDWPSDPLSLIGAEALLNPIDHPDLFSEKRAAFVGERAEFGTERAILYAEAPQWIYRDDRPQLMLTLRMPSCENKGHHRATVESFATMQDSPLPRLAPESISPVACDNYDPPENVSHVDITFPADAEDTSFGITVKAGLQDIREEYWPIEQTLFVNYVDRDRNSPRTTDENGADTAEEEDEENPPTLTDFLAELESYLARIEKALTEFDAALEQVRTEFVSIKNEEKELSKKMNALRDTIVTLGKSVVYGAPADIRNILSDLRTLGEQYIDTRRIIERSTLAVCKVYENMKASEDAKAVAEIYSGTLVDYENVSRSYDQARNLRKRMNEAKARAGEISGKRDFFAILRPGSDIERSYRNLETAYANLKARIEQTTGKEGREQNAGVIEEFNYKTGHYQARVNEAKASLSGVKDKEDRKTFSGIEKVFARIKGTNEKLNNSWLEKNRIFAEYGQVLLNAGVSWNALAAVARKYPGPDPVNDEAEIREVNAQIQSTYDAAMIFSDAIEQAKAAAHTCFVAAEGIYKAKASPEARLARADCSKFPGTRPEWDAQDQKVRCNCVEGVWSNTTQSCVSEKDAAVARADCSLFPNTKPVWNEVERISQCVCIDNYVLNSGKTGCILKPELALAQASCANFGPYAEKFWDSRNEDVRCRCVSGYEWNASRDSCVRTYARQEKVFDDIDHGGRDIYGGGHGNDGHYDSGSYDSGQDDNNEVTDFVSDFIKQYGQTGQGSGASSGCTPGRTAAEKMINQALGCAGGNDKSGGSDHWADAARQAKAASGGYAPHVRSGSGSSAGSTTSRSSGGPGLQTAKPYAGGCPNPGSGSGVRFGEGPKISNPGLGIFVTCTYHEYRADGSYIKVDVTATYDTNPSVPFRANDINNPRGVVSSNKHARVSWRDGNYSRTKKPDSYWLGLCLDMLRRVEPYAAPRKY